MLAYLSMMAPRLLELRRVLKEKGSIYLHCDTTASAHLRLLMDAIFGPQNFRNEIIWKRAQPKSHTSVRMSRAHDVILFYAKSRDAKYRQQYAPHDPAYVDRFYKYVEEGTGRRYTLGDLTNPNRNRPNLTYEFPPGSGVVRVWRWTKERMQKAWDSGRVVLPPNGKVVRLKRYLDEMQGTPVTDIWDDIEHLHGSMQESLGYPTQKPEALLERIIEGSSEEGDLVLDPFCGCGTAIVVAHALERRWIGIDVTHLATTLIKNRLQDAFGEDVRATYEVIGEPTDLAGARELAHHDRMQFQQWALGLVGARPAEPEMGADRGIDGRLFFHDESKGVETKEIVISVKSGSVGVAQVRDLRGVIEREDAAIGVFITLEEPTRPMRKEAASAGFYQSPWRQKPYPRLQIFTVEELLKGARIACPPLRQVSTTFKRAARARRPSRERQKELGEGTR